MVGCQNGGSKNENGNLSKDETLEKCFEGYEQLKNGKINIASRTTGVRKNPKEGMKPEYWREKKFKGSFELRPNRVSGEITSKGSDFKYKLIASKYYGDSMLSYEKAQKPEKKKDWKLNQYSNEFYEQPVGFNYDFIKFLRANKKDVKLTEGKDSYTFTYETSDLKLVDPNNDLILGSLDYGFSLHDFHNSGSIKIEFKVSKEDFTPQGISYAGKFDSEYATEELTSKVTYSEQNSGVKVKTPDGVDKAIVG